MIRPLAEELVQHGVVRAPIFDRDEGQQLLSLSAAFYDSMGADTDWSGLGFATLIALPATLEANMFRGLIERACGRVCDLFDEYRFIPENSYFRRAVLGASSSVDWHCDAEAASMLSYGQDCITVWVPLEPVGVALPSLELIVGSHVIMRVQSTQDMLGKNRTDDWVASVPGERVVPCVDDSELGTAIVFSQYTLHRTQKLKVDRSRTNCEFRFTLI